MKKLVIPFAVIAVLTGCVAVRLKPGASVEVTSTNPPPVIQNIVTNPITIPNSFVASLDTNSEKALVDAIKASADKQIGPAQILLTNVNPINLYPTITNLASTPNPVSIKLESKTESALQKLAEDKKWYEKDSFMSTILGGALALVGGVVATRLAYWLQAKQKGREDADFRINVLSALRRELEALREIYEKRIGADLEEITEGKTLWKRLDFTEDWFAVFSANAPNLGKLDPLISRKIITVYALQKALFEDFRINNELLDTKLLDDNKLLVKLGRNRNGLSAMLAQQAQTIQKRDKALKEEIAELFKLLDVQGII